MIKVAIIDDEIMITSMLQKVLSKNKEFEVSIYNNPLEALRHLKSSKVDVVLLDLMMPHMDGIKALNEIKNASPETKVIMMTAYPASNGATNNQYEGADDLISKPFKSLGAVEQKIIRAIKL